MDYNKAKTNRQEEIEEIVAPRRKKSTAKDRLAAIRRRLERIQGRRGTMMMLTISEVELLLDAGGDK